MRAAIYARVSTERQEQQQTISSQVAALRDWAAVRGHVLAEAHAFRDEGYSGSRLDRPALDALRDAVRDAAVDVVAVFSPDRLARKYAYQVLLMEEFRLGRHAVPWRRVPHPAPVRRARQHVVTPCQGRHVTAQDAAGQDRPRRPPWSRR